MSWRWRASSSSSCRSSARSGSLTHCVTSTTRSPSHRPSSFATPRGRSVWAGRAAHVHTVACSDLLVSYQLVFAAEYRLWPVFHVRLYFSPNAAVLMWCCLIDRSTGWRRRWSRRTSPCRRCTATCRRKSARPSWKSSDRGQGQLCQQTNGSRCSQWCIDEFRFAFRVERYLSIYVDALYERTLACALSA